MFVAQFYDMTLKSIWDEMSSHHTKGIVYGR